MAGAGVVVAAALRSSDEPPQAATTATVAAPLSGLPLVALPPVGGLTARRPARPAAGARGEGPDARRPADGDRVRAARPRRRRRPRPRRSRRPRRLGDPAADVALAVAGYDPKQPDATVARLKLLAPTQPFAALRAGRRAALGGPARAQATAALKAVRDAAPESFYGVKADDLLHPTMQPGYPLFVPADTRPAGATPTR